MVVEEESGQAVEEVVETNREQLEGKIMGKEPLRQLSKPERKTEHHLKDQ